MVKTIGRTSHYYIALALCIYSFTKLFWDKYFPLIFEAMFLALILYGTVMFFYKFKLKRNEIIIWLLWFFLEGYFLVNGYIAEHPQRLTRGLYEYNFYLLFFPACLYWGRFLIRNFDDFLKTLSKLSVILSFFAIIEFFLGKTLLGGVFSGTNINGVLTFRTKVFARSFLAFGMEMSILGVICFFLFIKSTEKRYLLYLLLNIIAILTTSSRGPLVALIISIVILYLWKQPNRKKIKSILKGTIVILFIFVSILFISKLTNNETVEYVLYRISSIFDWKHDAGNVGRINRWNRVLSIWNENRMFGVGVSATGSWDLNHVIITTESGVLKRLVELGLVGFGVYYMMIALVFIKEIKQQKLLEKNGKMNSKAMLICVVCILIEDTILQVTEEVAIAFLFWMLISLAINCQHYKQNDIEKEMV